MKMMQSLKFNSIIENPISVDRETYNAITAFSKTYPEDYFLGKDNGSNRINRFVLE
jgi:hypothetical protein